MIGKIDKQVLEKFKVFQEHEKGEVYRDLDLESVEFEKVALSDERYFEINPKKSEIEQSLKTSNIDVSFVPLEKINSENGTLDGSGTKKINDVLKGYTYFKDGDVIFTKVTPSMENGNFAIAQKLVNGIGFGSSEYHVFRCKNVLNKLLWMLFRSKHFKERAKRTMRGSGGLKRVPLDFFDNEFFAIPKPQNNYTSYDIQKAIVEFLEFWKVEFTDVYRNKIAKMRPVLDMMKKNLVASTFKLDSKIVESFNEFAKEKGFDVELEDIGFDYKKIHSDNEEELICTKRMGFTPKRDNNGSINWFTVRDLNDIDGLYINHPNTKEKTTINLVKQAVDKNNTGKSEKLIPIKKDDILVSFKLSVGITKIYNSDEIAYCNEAIDILTLKEGYNSLYVANLCILEYPKYGTRTNNGMTLNDDSKKDIDIAIPTHKEYNSIDLQNLLVSYWEMVLGNFEKREKLFDRALELCDKLDEVFLYRIFSKIEWSK